MRTVCIQRKDHHAAQPHLQGKGRFIRHHAGAVIVGVHFNAVKSDLRGIILPIAHLGVFPEGPILPLVGRAAIVGEAQVDLLSAESTFLRIFHRAHCGAAEEGVIAVYIVDVVCHVRELVDRPHCLGREMNPQSANATARILPSCMSRCFKFTRNLLNSAHSLLPLGNSQSNSMPSSFASRRKAVSASISGSIWFSRDSTVSFPGWKKEASTFTGRPLFSITLRASAAC